jgi:hypothetical protein
VNQARTPLPLKEALRWEKVRTDLHTVRWTWSRSIDGKRKWMAGFVLPLCPAREIAEGAMEAKEKPDSYGEWAIRRVEQEAEEHGNPLPAQVITTARKVWPRIAMVVANELKREHSFRACPGKSRDAGSCSGWAKRTCCCSNQSSECTTTGPDSFFVSTTRLPAERSGPHG